MSEKNEINVHIGEVKAGEPNCHLQAILGSCIGIALIDVKMHLCTLSHSLLPFHATGDPERPGRWVNQAVLAAIDMMNVAPGRVRKLHAVVAGGGSMIDGADKRRIEVGRGNCDAAFEVLREMNITVVAQDTGGFEGRKISICSDSLQYQIETIPRSLSREATA